MIWRPKRDDLPLPIIESSARVGGIFHAGLIAKDSGELVRPVLMRRVGRLLEFVDGGIDVPGATFLEFLDPTDGLDLTVIHIGCPGCGCSGTISGIRFNWESLTCGCSDPPTQMHPIGEWAE